MTKVPEAPQLPKVWPTIFKTQLRNKFRLDYNGYIKYPENIDEILNIIERAVREQLKQANAKEGKDER